MPDDPSTDSFDAPADPSAGQAADPVADPVSSPVSDPVADPPADPAARPPATPMADAMADALADPGRPDPAPAAPPPWPLPGDPAVLNPLAPAGTPEPFHPSFHPPFDPPAEAAPPRSPSPDTDDPSTILFDEDPPSASFPAAYPFADIAGEGAAGALPEWPAPAPAPGAPIGALPFDAAPQPYRVVPAADAPVDRLDDDGLSAAAPSTPSVPWDRHQDFAAASAPPSTRVQRMAGTAGANLLYWVGGTVVVILAVTALLVNGRARLSDPQSDADDKAASAASVDGGGGGNAQPPADRAGDDQADDLAPDVLAPDAAAPVDVDAAVALTSTGGLRKGGEGGSAASASSASTTGAKETTGSTGSNASTLPSTSMAGAASRTSAAAQAASGADTAPAATGADVEGAFVVPDGYRRYDDAQHGFSLRVPSDWREAHRSSGPGDAAEAPDYDVVFEAAEGEQRLAVSVWSAAERPPFDVWLAAAVAGMRPLDDGAADGEGVPYNAFLAGEPSLVLGAAETPVSHLSYAAYLQHGERYLRIAWADMTGLTRPDDVLGALASFGWVGDDIVTGSAPQANQVPRLRLPQGVYWPSDVLFEESPGR